MTSKSNMSHNNLWVLRPVDNTDLRALKRIVACLQSEMNTVTLSPEKAKEFALSEREAFSTNQVLRAIHRNGNRYPLLRMQITRLLEATTNGLILKAAKELAGSQYAISTVQNIP